ncbi:MAG: hypothetical protein WKF36_09850 [Candidatus Nitrosocosmicus sp.]
MGEVQEVSNGYVLVQRGIINKEKFYIPQDQAEIYDGDVLKFRLSEDEIINKYTGIRFRLLLLLLLLPIWKLTNHKKKEELRKNQQYN